MVGHRSSNTPLLCYFIGVAIFNCLAFFSGSLLFVQWMMVFILAAILGEILFGLLVGGLFSDYWFKGQVIGTSLLACWALCLVSANQWSSGFQVNVELGALWFLFALPAMILGGSTPLLICRSAFGWKLIRENAPARRERFAVEDLLLTTAAIASVMFLCRVPQIASETPQNLAMNIIAYGIAFFLVASLVLVIPMVYITYRCNGRRRRWLGYGILFGGVYALALLPSRIGPGVMWFALAMPLGLFIPLLLGIRVLQLSGYQLASRATKNELTNESETKAISSHKRTRRRWVFGTLVFSAASSLSLNILDSSDFE